MVYGDRYKKTDERFIEWQRVVQQMIASGTTNDNEWQQMKMSDSEWYNEWQKMTMSDSEWQKVVQRVKAAHLLQKKKKWIIAILSTRKIHTLLQGMNGWY